MFPYCIWSCGTVGDIKGYPVPFINAGEHKLVNPKRLVWFGIVWLKFAPCPC